MNSDIRKAIVARGGTPCTYPMCPAELTAEQMTRPRWMCDHHTDLAREQQWPEVR